MFGSVEQAFDLGAAGVGATIYFGSPESTRQIQEVSEAFARAHELGMFTVLWCYLRNSGFKVDGVDHHASADLTAQANHLGVTIQADIIKQKLPETNGGYRALPGYGAEKTKIFVAILAKRMGVAPEGWEAAAGPFADDKPRSVADIDSPEALATVRAWKKAQKAAGKSKQD